MPSFLSSVGRFSFPAGADANGTSLDVRRRARLT
jgi:hypothetical protein